MFKNFFYSSPSAGDRRGQDSKATDAGKPNSSLQISLDRVIDLRGDARLTSLLMRGGFWRSRIVETITIDRALAAHKSRKYQVAPLIESVKEVLEKSDIDADHAHVVLPLGPVPKNIMVGFDVKVQLGEAFLLKRREIAEREVLFIKDLAQIFSIPLGEEVTNFLAAICEFTPGPWQQVRAGRRPFWRSPFRRNSKHIQAYLNEGLDFEIKGEDLQSWQKSADYIGRLMLKALNEPPDQDSASENILLALPILKANRWVSNAVDVSKYIELLRQFIDMCEKKEIGEGVDILQVIAEYGKRFQLLIDCKVPLREPTSVEVVQDVPLRIGLRGRSKFDVTVNDAISNYAVIRVADPDVQLKWRRREISSSNGEELPPSLFNLVRESKEDLAIYGSELNRPNRIIIRFRLTLPWVSKIVIMAFALLIIAAIYPVVHLRNLTSEDLGVFTVPTTLAAGLILIQQRTSLGLRLQRGLRLLIVGAIMALWTIVLVAYLRGWIKMPPA